MTRTLLLIGLGGAIGSIFRYLTTIIVNKYFQTVFPWATFITNILGCLLIGALLGLFEKQLISNPNLKFLLITGFCGGYTTFSTFASENINLLQSGNTLLAIVYITASIALSLIALVIGLETSKLI